MDNSAERIRILEMIDSGQINAEEGLRLLADLQDQADLEEDAGADLGEPISAAVLPPALDASPVPGFVDAAETVPSTASGPGWEAAGAASPPAAEAPVQPEIVDDVRRQDFERWKSYWMVPVWIGAAITVLGGLWMYWALQSRGLGFWFFCATIPFALGVIVLVIGAESRNARWLHLRVQQAPGERPQRIAFSFPLPIRFTAWFLRTFRTKIRGMENVPADIDQMLVAMGEATSPDNPIYIKVDDDEDGDKVEIFIG